MQEQHSNDFFQLQDEILNLADPNNATLLREPIELCANPAIAYRAIIDEWRTGCYNADVAVRWLHAYGLIAEPYRGDAHRLMVDAAICEFGPHGLPDSFLAPIPSVSKGKPFNPTQK